MRRVAGRHDSLVLAVAGGIVSDPETYATVLSRYHTIWVKASPEEHMNRVRAQGDMRPMQGRPEAMVQLRALLEARDADYKRAEASLETSDKTPENSLDDLLALIRNRGFLDT